MQARAGVVTYRDFLEPALWVDRGGRSAELRLFYHGEQWHSFEASLDWLRLHAEPEAVLATSCPHLAYLRTGRRAVMPPMERDSARAQRLLDSVPAGYLVLDQLDFLDVSHRYAAPVVSSHASLWELAFDNGGVRVYRRRAAARS